MATKLTEWKLKFDENASSGLDRIQAKSTKATAGMDKLEGGTTKATKGFGGFQSMLGGVTSAFPALGSAMTFALGPIGLITAGVAAIGAAGTHLISVSQEIRTAQRDVGLAYGLTGSQLDAVTAKTQALTKTLGVSSEELNMAGLAVSKGFGIDATQALELYQKAVMAGADINGELIAQMKEYPAQAREAGLSAQEFFGIITQSAQQGIYSDKGIDAIKEAGLRLRELPNATKDALGGLGLSASQIQSDLNSGAKSVFDVIQDVSGAMGNVSVQARQTAIADIFGGPGEDAGADFLMMLGKMETDLDKLGAKNAGLNSKLSKQLGIQEQLAAEQLKFAGVFNKMGDLFTNTLTTLQLYGYRAVNMILDLYNNSVLVRDLISSFGFVFKATFMAAEFLVMKLVNSVRGLMGALGFEDTNPFTALLTGLENLWLTTKVIFGRIVQLVATSGQTIGKLMSGDLAGAATSGADVINQFNRLTAKSTASAVADMIAKSAEASAKASGQRKTDASTAPSAPATGQAPVQAQAAIAGINGGGKQVRNVNVSIRSLVETLTIQSVDGGIPETELVNIIQAQMVRAVQGAEQTLN